MSWIPVGIRRLMSALGYLGFGFSAVVHGLTFLGIDPLGSWPELSVVHSIAMGAAISVVLSGNNRPTVRGSSNAWPALDAAERKETEKLLSAITSETQTPAQKDAAEAELVKKMRPGRGKAMTAILGAYAVINFVVSLGLLRGGTPGQSGDEYMLFAHGKVIQVLSLAEYRWACAYQTRLATGHWMFLFFLCATLWAQNSQGNSGLAHHSQRLPSR
jgi:hypothetical protein